MPAVTRPPRRRPSPNLAEDQLFPARQRGLGPGWFFLGLGLVLTAAIVGWFVLPTIRQSLERPNLASAPDYASLVAATAPLPGADQIVRLEAVPLPSYLVGYMSADNSPSVALATWNRYYHQYDWVSRLSLGQINPKLTAVTSVQRVDLGKGIAVFVVAGPSGTSVSPDTQVLVALDGDHLRQILRLDSGAAGTPLVISDLRSDLTAHTAPPLTFSDVDIDGLAELVQTITQRDDYGHAVTLTVVYRWQQGDFVYDSQLSDLVKLQAGLFPEP